MRKLRNACRSPVGAGLPAKGPGLQANIHPPFTVAAATVFAGKPAPTPDGVRVQKMWFSSQYRLPANSIAAGKVSTQAISRLNNVRF
ncbi:hypothetical protein CXB65_13125 [Pseudomonas monteilii]|uniref:Uncharacterized protein n=1 Tax=Pseudomonas monteilii TaxID=76759 RepID=A0A2N1IS84_9PSED|nr:hypothetical protein CXB65_13125 [Pseudomonas monteilii]RPD92245.1 hypothetical protein EGN69_18875 [Pseudomonas monteilii]